MLEKYSRLVQTCQPYAVVNRGVLPYCNLAPLGLTIPPENLLSPFTRASDTFLDALAWLDRMTFGFSGMEMPRWVFYDCSEIPGGICGFTRPLTELPRSIFQGSSFPHGAPQAWPVSMAIAIPVIPEGAWLKHTLCSINELSHLAAPAGLRTLTFAMALEMFRVQTLYSTTQWRASELQVHAKFGDLELLTAYTPAHTDPRTLTYRFEVTPERIRRALAGRDAYAPPPPEAFFLDADDVDGMLAVQRRIEAGERLFVCGRPIRDGSTTWVPLRAQAS
jgi:hypothetical protein